jgi:hypothetical protein
MTVLLNAGAKRQMINMFEFDRSIMLLCGPLKHYKVYYLGNIWAKFYDFKADFKSRTSN